MPKLSIKKNTDPYINNVSLFLPFNSNFNDNSSNNFSVTAYGNTQISSTQSKFGGASAYFDGNGDYLEIGDNNAFELENNDFTIECWFYLTNNTKGYQSILNKSHATADQNGWVLYFETNNSLHFIAGNSFWSIDLNSGVVPTINTWHHVAITRSGNNWRLFYNGDIVASTINNLSFSTGTLPLYIGRYPYFPSWSSTMDFSGYIDDLRITKGVARYTSNFVPRSILPNNDKLQLINSIPFIRDSTSIRNTVLPILRSSITNFYNYNYDGFDSSIGDGGSDMYDGGNRVYLNGVQQSYNTESADTFCYTSYPFIYKTTQTSNFTLSVQGNYGSDGAETKYQDQQDFIHQARKFSIYISESLDNNNNDPSIVECFIVLYPNSKPTINFTYVGNNNENGNETISVSNLNGQSVTAFYLLLSTRPRYQIGSATLFDVLKTFVVNCSGGSSFNHKLTVKTQPPFPIHGLLAFWRLNNTNGLSTISSDFGSYTLNTYGGYTSVPGKINNAFDFSSSDEGMWTNEQILNLLTNPTSFSVSFWAKITEETTFCVGSAFGSMGFHFEHYGPQYGSLGFVFRMTKGIYIWNQAAHGVMSSLSQWHHIVGTYNHSSATMKLYVNNSLVATTTNVIIGANSEPNWHGFALNGTVVNGGKVYGNNQSLDAVGFWNRDLTISEVATLYNGGNGSEI